MDCIPPFRVVVVVVIVVEVVRVLLILFERPHTETLQAETVTIGASYTLFHQLKTVNINTQTRPKPIHEPL